MCDKNVLYSNLKKRDLQGRVVKNVAKKDRKKRAERPTKKSQPKSADSFALCEKNAVLKNGYKNRQILVVYKPFI
jgi:hypothetical protein